MSASLPYLVDLADPDPPRFVPVDDPVMGGRSASRFRRTGEGTGIFEGVLSLKNDGGFASVRARIESTDLSAGAGVRLRVRGDGQRYRLLLRNDQKISGLKYVQDFGTRKGKWEEIYLAFRDFRPSLRGWEPPDARSLDTTRIRQVGLMIAEEQEGPFRLELAWIRGWDGREGGFTSGQDLPSR